MSETIFNFKHFSVRQNLCAMKVGTDGVLLGSWIRCDDAKRVLDIGSGTGLIALMIAQRSKATVDAIDIDKSAFIQSSENFRSSKWHHRLNAFHESIQAYSQSSKKYDVIVSNPPFFLNGFSSNDKLRNIARISDETLNFDELIECSADLMHKESKLSLILPKKESDLFIEKCRVNGLFCLRKTMVYTKANKEVKRVLLEFGYTNSACDTNLLCLRNEDGDYTREYLNLVEHFYLESHLSSVNSEKEIPISSNSFSTGT
ncbi:MAG TPA: methyltransferase [Bacteroidia bacterium]|nr:methyltransferase [Bacteroidia bacterium]HNT81101.1 methyltransferase [Bacteroidia bacterium]